MKLKLNKVYFNTCANKHFIIIDMNIYSYQVQYLSENTSFAAGILSAEKVARQMKKQKLEEEILEMLNKEVKFTLIEEYSKII